MREDGVHSLGDSGEYIWILTCVRCGRFEVNGFALAHYENRSSYGLNRNRYLLSGRARNATLDGRNLRSNDEDFDAAEQGKIPEKTVEEKIHLMLGWVVRSSTKVGQQLTPDS